MKHYITIAAMFESRPDCLIYLNESMKNEDSKSILSWASLYNSGVTQLVYEIESGGVKRSKKTVKNQALHDKSTKILLAYMKQIVQKNKILEKQQWKTAFKAAEHCCEEYERIEKVMEIYGVEEQMKTDNLKELVKDLVEVKVN